MAQLWFDGGFVGDATVEISDNLLPLLSKGVVVQIDDGNNTLFKT